MSNYRRAKLVFDSFRSRKSSILLLNCSRIVAKDVTGRLIQSSSTLLPSNTPHFRGFFSSLMRAQSSSTSSLSGSANLPRVRAPNRKRLYFLSFLGSVVVFVLCFGKFETIPYTNRTHFVILRPNWEKKLGDMVIELYKSREELYKGKMLPDTHPQTIHVRRIVNRITEALQREIETDQYKKGSRVVATSHLDGKKWDLIVKEDPRPVALLLPSDIIVVYTGLLHHCERDEEIASHIGHEIAHGVARHAAERLSNPMLFLTLLRFGINRAAEYDPDDYYFPKLTIYWFSHLRRMEIEADYIGMLLMASAGYDPRVAIDSMTKNYKDAGDDLNKEMRFFSHPSGKERVEKMSQVHVMEEAMSKYREVRARYEDINKEEY